MVEPRVVIFLGSDELEKQKKIELVQQKFFPPSLKDLNYTVLYADDRRLTPIELKEAIVSLPTEGAQKRLVVIKQAHKLKRALLECLIEEAGRKQDKTAIILDVPDVKGSEDFVREFSRIGAAIVRFKSEVAANAFDLGRAISAHKTQAALEILSGLLGRREKAEKILGGLFWQWERLGSEGAIAQDVFKKGLKTLLEADRKLKSTSSAYARESLILETLVVKLSYLV